MFIRNFVVAALAVAPVAGQAAQYVKQGNFQSGPSSLTSFQSTSNTRVISGAEYVQFAGGSGSGKSRSNLFASFGANNLGGLETLSQSFDTLAGKDYVLRFDYGLFAYDLGGDESFEVLIDGEQVATYSPIGTADLDAIFTRASLNFVGIGGPIQVQFRVVARDNDGRDIVIDNISVTPVPEAATWTLMIAGFTMVGFAARLRNRRLSAA